MSYIRAGWPLKYVEGESEDYIFGYDKDKDGKWLFEDYGRISDSGFIELLFDYWDAGDENDFKEHLLKRLADRLGVKLRDRPLSEDEYTEEMDRIMKEFEKKESEAGR